MAWSTEIMDPLPLGALDHDERLAQRRHQTVARREPERLGLDARRVLGDDRARGRDPLDELRAAFGVRHVEARPQHGDAGPTDRERTRGGLPRRSLGRRR